jgi:hypothetical protein
MRCWILALVLGLLAAPCMAQSLPGPSVSSKSGPYVAMPNTGQYGLAVGTGTKLTVPPGALCAFITVGGASVRRTSDGTAASSTVGTLFTSGTQWSDCGPLSSYQFSKVSGSPTLDVEFFD